MTRSDVGAFVNRCHDKETSEGLDSLTDFEKTLVHVSSLNFEIDMGGLGVFFYNSASDDVHEQIQALRTIGADVAADAVEESVALYPDPRRITDRDYRQRYLDVIDGDLPAIIVKYRRQQPLVFDLLIEYVQKNIPE